MTLETRRVALVTGGNKGLGGSFFLIYLKYYEISVQSASNPVICLEISITKN